MECRGSGIRDMAQNCAYTGAMRIYYPFLGSELAQGNFPSRNAYCVRPDAGLHGEDLEVAEDDARTLAALDSLAFLRDEESGSFSRCIIAADIERPIVTRSPPTSLILQMLLLLCGRFFVLRHKMTPTRPSRSCGKRAWSGTRPKNANCCYACWSR